ncbi:hypothetical protein [Treponema phagedenis]|uniref:hypothetical protein n=1 Tax=Treponema phagedenis TaxID=162 RepID=UPI001652EC23|nr:hypothetical protein [Treponema phagedenis]
MKKLRFISFAILATALIVVSCQGPANPTKEPGNVQKAEEKKPEVKDPKAEEKKPEVKDPKAEEKKPEVKDPKAEEKKPEVKDPKAEEKKPEVKDPKAEEKKPEEKDPKAEEKKPEVKDPKAEEKKPEEKDPKEEELHEFIGELCETAEEEEMPADEVSRWVELAQEDFEQFGVKIVDKEADKPIKKGASEEDLKKRFVLEKYSKEDVLHVFIGELCEIAEEEEMPADEVSRWVELAQEDFEQFGVKIVDKEADKPIKKGASEEDLKKRFVLE